MTNLNEMSVSEAASKALELIIYGDYMERISPEQKYSFMTPYKGTFEAFIDDYYRGIIEENGDEFESFDFDSVWQELKDEGSEGTRDGWTGKVEAEYGGEGQGDQYWMVVSVSDGTTTRYFRKDGWYASYDGGTLDGDVSEVRPEEKVITVYV